MLSLIAVPVLASPETSSKPVAGRVVTWGGGTPGEREALRPPIGLDDAVTVAASETPAGAYDLALRADGTVVGWGTDPYGATTPPEGLADVKAIDTGAGFSAALKSDGSIAAWGVNATGQLDVPVGLGEVIAISAGGFIGAKGQPCGYGLALRADATVVRWGHEPDTEACLGQLGATLDPPSGLRGVVAISAGARHALALLRDGTVVGWGHNGAGQAQPPDGLSDVVAIAAGASHSIALKADGTVVGWGVWGESGPPTVSDATAVAASLGDVILRRDGSIFLWTGYTWGDQPAGSSYAAVAAGYGHGAAIVRPADPRPADPPKPPDTSEPIVAVGSTDLQPSVDENPPGTAEAFRSVASAGGTSTSLRLYVDESNEAEEVVVGVYSENWGRPGSLLASGRLAAPVGGAWNTVELPPIAIAEGRPYWLAILGPRDTGRLRFRDLAEGEGGPTQISRQTWLHSLPAYWRSGRSFANAPASLHLTLG